MNRGAPNLFDNLLTIFLTIFLTNQYCSEFGMIKIWNCTLHHSIGSLGSCAHNYAVLKLACSWWPCGQLCRHKFCDRLFSLAVESHHIQEVLYSIILACQSYLKPCCKNKVHYQLPPCEGLCCIFPRPSSLHTFSWPMVGWWRSPSDQVTRRDKATNGPSGSTHQHQQHGCKAREPQWKDIPMIAFNP